MHDADLVARMVRAGGVYYNVSGKNPAEVFDDAVARLELPSGVIAADLVAGLRERESLMTTSVGNGIALPHPRAPVIREERDERIYVCFLDKAVNFDAMDGKPVYVLFIILSTGAQSHLTVLSRLSWLFQQRGFDEILRGKPGTDELINAITRYQ